MSQEPGEASEEGRRGGRRVEGRGEAPEPRLESAGEVQRGSPPQPAGPWGLRHPSRPTEARLRQRSSCCVPLPSGGKIWKHHRCPGARLMERSVQAASVCQDLSWGSKKEENGLVSESAPFRGEARGGTDPDNTMREGHGWGELGVPQNRTVLKQCGPKSISRSLSQLKAPPDPGEVCQSLLWRP